MLLEPSNLGLDDGPGALPALLSFLAGAPAVMDGWVHGAGAVLLRGFGIRTPPAFRQVCAAMGRSLSNYIGGDSPRQGVAEQVYTSTEYPADLEVLLHNELSYTGAAPAWVFFGCLVAAHNGGETHIADGRRVYRRLAPPIRERFEARGVTYLQHLWHGDGPPGPGKSWQQTYETGDRHVVEQHLARSGMHFEWTELGLRTSATRDAMIRHPVTGEACWHNQADQWHRDLDSVKDAVPGSGVRPGGEAGEGALGNHVTFGDGTPIAVAELRAIRATCRECEVCFPWQAGDVLVLDNRLTMHGRKPFCGERRVLVVMA